MWAGRLLIRLFSEKDPNFNLDQTLFNSKLKFGILYALFQNLLFYYDSESCNRPSGVVFLEGCYCERIITTTGCSKKDLHDKQVRAFGSVSIIVLNKLRVSEVFTHEPSWLSSIHAFFIVPLGKDKVQKIYLLRLLHTNKTISSTLAHIGVYSKNNFFSISIFLKY